MSLAENFWTAKACWKGCSKQSPRDRVVVEGAEVHYVLWCSRIATWNQQHNTLRVDDRNWKTGLTFNRLNSILSKLSIVIRSIHSTTYLLDSKSGAEYRWEGTHTIQLDSTNKAVNKVRICPCVPRRVNVKVSHALQKYCASAVKSMNEQKVLVASVVDGGVVCLYPNPYYRNKFSMPLLGLYVDSGGEGLRAYSQRVACSKIYSAFKNNDAASLANYLAETGKLVSSSGSELFSVLSNFEVDLSLLPSKVLHQLAVLKLLEA